MPVLAHAGHWLVQIAYFLPVVIFLIWLAVTVVRERRSQDG
jgi:membrane protein implicated in regulation of membrane protease activity